jgi:tetratricopeptide (TPR) repeat protein
MREKLAQSISVQFEPNTPLKEAMGFIAERCGMTILINREAFKADLGEADIENKPISLPRLVDVSLGTVFRLILAQVQGTFIIRRDYIEITARPWEQTELDEDELEGSWNEILARRNLLSRARRGSIVTGGRLLFQGGVPVFQPVPSTGWKIGLAQSKNENAELPANPSFAGPDENTLDDVSRELRSVNATPNLGNQIKPVQTKPTFRNDWKDVDEFVTRFLAGLPFHDRNWLYQRSKFSGDERVFTYLTAYAPGMTTTRADELSVLEAEADADPASLPGRVDPAARRLIDRAQKANWQRVTIPEKNGERSFAVVLDGSGRFAIARILATGLREQVICDGKNLWHLYPELGVAAQRDVSRFHRADLAMLAPWALLPAEDLARGADLKCIDEQTVAIVPHSALGDGPRSRVPSREIRLLFSGDGRLAERQLVEMPSRTVIYRETYDSEGVVELVDSQGAVLVKNQFTVAPAQEPVLKPDPDDFVVSHLPLRNRNHLSQTGPADRQNGQDKMPMAATLGLIAKQVAWRQLLKSGAGDPVKGLLHRLLDLHALYERRDTKLSRPELEHALQQIRQGPKDAIAWAMLGLIQDRIAGDQQAAKALAELYPLFANCSGLSYEARYEHARSLLLSSRRQEARRVFLEIYRQHREKGILPPIDRSFRQALIGERQEPDEWTPLMRQTAEKLAAAKRRPEVVILSWQCWQIGDRTLSDQLLRVALEGAGSYPDGWQGKLAAIEFLWQTRRLQAGDKALESLLADPAAAGRSSLWRLGARLALERRLPARFAQCLERALEIDSQHPPEMTNLEAVRTDFGLLLDHYQQLTDAHAILKTPPPVDLPARVVRFVDYWRALDPDNPTPCVVAAQILDKLGEADLAWEYMNTPAAILPFDGQAWSELADALSRQEDFLLAERAYEQALAAEPDNARILADRAQNWERAADMRTSESGKRRIGD